MHRGYVEVHYTWAGAAALEALCLMFPTVNFALIDSDCVPTSLFEVAELVNLMTDKSSRAAAMQYNTMASNNIIKFNSGDVDKTNHKIKTILSSPAAAGGLGGTQSDQEFL